MKFLSYLSSATSQPRVGLVNATEDSVTPFLDPCTGEPIVELFDLLEDWDAIADSLRPGEPVEKIRDVKVLAPLRGRDVIAVGKNYVEHAKEFSVSGYDASDTGNSNGGIPHSNGNPVIFTKRATSIIPHGALIYPHEGTTETLDYEGELGVIIGKAGFKISKEDAWQHVWGYTIVNDVTAREKQRDHKQFYLGKSLDTFCPMGPYVVPSSHLDGASLTVETRVNGEVRQRSTTNKLIFDIPTLVSAISDGITLQPGDVIATGTPAGVGFGFKPPKFLKPGDKVDISITGLGTLSNTVGPYQMQVPSVESWRHRLSPSAAVAAPDCDLVTMPSGKRLHVEISEPSSSDVSGGAETVLFIHGLGGTLNFFRPVIEATKLGKTHRLVCFDLEGHGSSPVSYQRTKKGTAQKEDRPSIDGYVQDVKDVLEATATKGPVVIVAHSMGGLIANTFAAAYPELVSKMILIGPIKAIPSVRVPTILERATLVREKGMSAVVNAILHAGLSSHTRSSRPLSISLVRQLLQSASPEGYARACEAMAIGRDPEYGSIKQPVLIISGDEDQVSPAPVVEALGKALCWSRIVQLEGVGHWHAVEDVEGCARLFDGFLKSNVQDTS